MQELLIPVLVGGSVLALGLLLIRSHLRDRRVHQNDPLLTENERRHFELQFWRRMQGSALLSLLGILLGLSTDKLPWNPKIFAVYLLVLLGLVIWIVLLALGDMISSRYHTRAALTRLRRQRQELEANLYRLRQKKEEG